MTQDRSRVSPLRCLPASSTVAGLIGFVLIGSGFQAKASGREQCSKIFSVALSPLRRQQTYSLKFETGRVVHVEVIAPARPTRPTLIYLPGINRGRLLNESDLQRLAGEGFGVATFHFSLHPSSINDLNGGDRPYFHSRTPTIEDLRAELNAVLSDIKAQFPLSPLIPITLSYSATLSPKLSGVPVIIETVPMTSEPAANPQGASYRSSLRSAEIFNPFFGAGITRSLIDQSYANFWPGPVAEVIKEAGLNKSLQGEMVAGAVALSRAAEDLSWDDQPLTEFPRRFFIIALNERTQLLKHQLHTIQRLRRQNVRPTVFAVKDSGHLIMLDQPATYAAVVGRIANASHQATWPDVTIIQPAKRNGTINEPESQSELSGEAAERWFNSILQN